MLTYPIQAPKWTTTLIVAAVCGVYVWPSVYHSWIPHDIGILAQSAERICDGQLPHRDFDELYTGGLSYYHALGFQVLGTQLSSIRTVFFAVCLLFFISFHRIARRLAPPGLGELTVFAAVAWSIPNYFESMPSWYNLFFATFGIAALLRFVDTEHRAWLVAAGLCGAASVLCKIVGLYCIAAIYLFLTYRRQLLVTSYSDTPHRAPAGLGIVPAAIGLVSLVWLLLVGLMVRRNLSPMLIVQLIVPSLAVVAAACGAALRRVQGVDRGKPVRQARASDTPHSRDTQRTDRAPRADRAQRASDTSRAVGAVDPKLRHQANWKLQAFDLLADWGAFTLGVAVPVGAFWSLFLVFGAVDDLLRGVFVLPFTRLTGASFPFPEGWLPLSIAGLFWLLSLTLAFRNRWDKWLALTIIAGAGWLSYLSIWEARTFAILAARLIFPGLAVTVAAILIGDAKRLKVGDQQVLFLLLTVAAFCAFVQFPFAAPVYFCFVAPLVMLLLQAVCNLQAEPRRFTAWSSACVGLLFAVGYVNPFSFFEDPIQVSRDPPIHLLTVPRGGIYVSQRDRDVYEELVSSIQAHSLPHDAILATPDCPEVYFLSSRRNPTRNLIELFEQATTATGELSRPLAEQEIAVVVINLEPKHSAHLSQEVIDGWLSQFEHHESIGNFRVGFNRKP